MLACVSKGVVFKWIIKVTRKAPIALQKSFDEIDAQELAPYKVINKTKIANKEVLEALGTEDYIQWLLEDTEVDEKSPVRICSLFITYYGKSDRVPHVPDECFIGSGYDKIAARHNFLNIEGQANPIEMRLLVFRNSNSDAWSSDPDFSRMYFFNVNNDYKCTRTGVRRVLGKNLRGKHSFFSKVEWEFFGRGFGGRSRPSDEQNIAASEKLMSKILPLLENEHWPNLDEIESDENTEPNINDKSKKE